MTESEFWEHLRTCINLSNATNSVGYCDWIEPKRYMLGSEAACISGKIGFVSPTSHEYGFRLSLPEQPESLSEMNWGALLPEHDSSSWITIDHGLVVIDTVGNRS